jgi:hypothetical protein
MRVFAWHFTAKNAKLGFGDGRKIVVGEALTVLVPGTHGERIACCQYGLHGSRQIIDALQYAQGPMLQRVIISGTIAEQDDKLCGSCRRCMAMADATQLQWLFARWCALQQVHLWEPPQIVLDFLTTGDPKKRDAAWDSASTAARDAANTAARDAARDAAWDAARDAARDAAWDAARAAAWDAARDAAWAATNTAAWDAASTAARAAARDAQNRQFESWARDLLAGRSLSTVLAIPERSAK